MAKYYSGKYKPKNIEKYVGNKYPTYRSTWELHVFSWLDNNENITKWGSEPVKIPYVHPFTGKVSNYIPDLIVEYVTKGGKIEREIIEIKPYKQCVREAARNENELAVVEVNHEKWRFAREWAKNHGMKFRVMTEKDIYNNK